MAAPVGILEHRCPRCGTALDFPFHCDARGVAPWRRVLPATVFFFAALVTTLRPGVPHVRDGSVAQAAVDGKRSAAPGPDAVGHGRTARDVALRSVRRQERG